MIDRFNWFCLSNLDKEFLKQFFSPKGELNREVSLFKNIPIEYLDRTKKILRKLGCRSRIVYRGPRTNQIDPSFTRKADALRFSVYPRWP